MLAGGLRPLPGRLVTDSRSALGARRARPHATPFAQQHLKFHGPPNSGRSVAEWAPSLKKATGASRPSLQQRLPGAEGPPEGRSTAPRHAACGGPIPSSRGPVLIKFFLARYSHGTACLGLNVAASDSPADADVVHRILSSHKVCWRTNSPCPPQRMHRRLKTGRRTAGAAG